MVLSALIGCMIGLSPLFLDAVINIFRKKKSGFAHDGDGPCKEYPSVSAQYEKLSQEHRQISRDFQPYADKIVRIDSNMTLLLQRVNQYNSLSRSLSEAQAELSRLSAENHALKQAVQEKDQLIARMQADLEHAHKSEGLEQQGQHAFKAAASNRTEP